MSWTTKQYATVVVVALLVASIPLVWQIADARAAASAKVDQASNPVTARQASGDYDGDGIPDDADRCPTRPETQNGFQDADGCPDTVATTGAS